MGITLLVLGILLHFTNGAQSSLREHLFRVKFSSFVGYTYAGSAVYFVIYWCFAIFIQQFR